MKTNNFSHTVQTAQPSTIQSISLIILSIIIVLLIYM